MPECNFFVRNGYCSNGEECLYLHVDPDSKIPRCPHYENGFCPLGPRCAKKHVRKTICKFYFAGFCPDGKVACVEGAHPRWCDPKGLAAPTVKRVREEGSEGKEREREWEERERGFGGRGGGGGGGGFGRRRFYGRRERSDR
jgi:cleavage and polyadenylation specificity factor subunit 4